jgi:hypothetical protein
VLLDDLSNTFTSASGGGEEEEESFYSWPRRWVRRSILVSSSLWDSWPDVCLLDFFVLLYFGRHPCRDDGSVFVFTNICFFVWRIFNYFNYIYLFGVCVYVHPGHSVQTLCNVPCLVKYLRQFRHLNDRTYDRHQVRDFWGFSVKLHRFLCCEHSYYYDFI